MDVFSPRPLSHRGHCSTQNVTKKRHHIMQVANLVFKTAACDPLANARGRGTLTRSRSDTHRRTALIRCQRPTDESLQAVAIKPCEKRSLSKGSELQLSRRNLVTGTGLALSLTASSAMLGGGPAFAEEAIFWDGVGRRPNAIVTGANTGIGKSISGERFFTLLTYASSVLNPARKPFVPL